MRTFNNSITIHTNMKTTLQFLFRHTLFFILVVLFSAKALSQEVNLIPPAPFPEMPMEPTVSLHIYSGMPPPECTLSDQELKQITTILEKLPPGKAEQGVGINSAMGYVGITLTIRDAANKDHYTFIKVYRDHVVVRQHSIAARKSIAATVYKRDEGRLLESLLSRFLDEKHGLISEVKEQVASKFDVRDRLKKK